jgi:hypothetical protein
MPSKKTRPLPSDARVIDEKDPMWSSLDNLTVGMTPHERAQYLMDLVETLTKKQAPKSESEPPSK